MPGHDGLAQLPLDEDHHVHSTWSNDGVSTLAENVQAAQERGLRTLLVAEHVRHDSAWVPDFAAAAAELPRAGGLAIVTGVEVKILDRSGRLDLPGDLAGTQFILIADHQYPGGPGPVRPDKMRAALAQGQVTPAEVIAGLAVATVNALRRTAGERPGAAVSLAHLFSILPKMGLAESAVGDAELAALIGAAADTGAQLEVNEKWGCPGGPTVRAFAEAGVPLVASTDSHHCATIGRYDQVRRIRDGAFARAGT
jgi:putative hydrolase